MRFHDVPMWKTFLFKNSDSNQEYKYSRLPDADFGEDVIGRRGRALRDGSVYVFGLDYEVRPFIEEQPKFYLIHKYKRHQYDDIGWEEFYGVFDSQDKAREEIVKFFRENSINSFKEDKWNDCHLTRCGKDIFNVCFSVSECFLNHFGLVN